jgi:prepilin-type processing-associated H-X9-DG protein
MIVRTFAASVVALIVSLAPFAAAQPLADRVPADALIYVGWAGADSMGPGYEGSHLKAVLEAGQIPQFINDVVPKLLDQLAQKEPDAAQFGDVAKAVLAPMWRHSTALYVGPVDMTNPDRPMPRAALVCDAGNDAATMRGKLDELIQQAGQNVPFPVAVRQSGNVVAVVIGKVPAIEGLLDGKSAAKALGAAKTFAPVASLQKSPVIAAYVDAEGIVKLVDEAVAKGRDADAKQKWPAARDTLGLRGLKRITLAEGFDGKEWGTHAFLEAPAPRQGLLAGIEAQPVTDEVLKIIPVTATLAGVGRFDLAKFFDGIRSTVEKLEPQSKKKMDEGIDQVNATIGMDVRKDVLAAFGDQWAYYLAPEMTGRGPLGLVVVNRLADEAKAQKASDKLKELANNIIAGEIKEPNVHVSLKEATIDGVTVHYLATPYVTPSWAIKGGNLYMGLYPQIVSQAAGHVSKEGKSILDNPGFVALRKRLGGEKAVSIQFYDLPKSAPTSYQIWLLVSSFAKLGDIFGVDTPPTLLPPLDKLLQHMTIAGSVSYVDEKGWHFRAVSPFPGSTVIASDTGGIMDVQTTALGISVLLPSLNRAREQANRVKSASNLRQIGMAGMIYANENKGKFPDDAGTVLLGGDITAEVFVSPRTGTAVPRGLEGDALKNWANEQSDYVWLGKGKTTNATSEEVLAYEKPERVTDGINVLYADGHVDWVSMPQAMQMIEKVKQGGGGAERPARPDGL